MVLVQSGAYDKLNGIVFLFFTNLIWTVMYDTQYAMADFEDDKHLPIFSSVKSVGQWIFVMLFVLKLMLLVAAWFVAYLIGFWAIVGAIFTSLLLGWQYYCLQQGDWHKEATVVFLSNNYLGAIWCLLLAINYYF